MSKFTLNYEQQMISKYDILKYKYDKLEAFVLNEHQFIYCNNDSYYCDDCPLGKMYLNICDREDINYSK
jgi:hypothetical protein